MNTKPYTFFWRKRKAWHNKNTHASLQWAALELWGYVLDEQHVQSGYDGVKANQIKSDGNVFGQAITL